jgi:aryl-alcohol dehydrogenase-like predicted oxidoreductase
MTAIPAKPMFSGGPAVSRLCLGAMMFADQTDEAESARILDAYFEAGGDFIDTADTYVSGESERMLGRLLGERRKSCFLATKVGNPLKTVPGSGGNSRQWIARAAEDSLDRLQTDLIDLYYLHIDDNVTPLEETIGALGELIAAGKVRH